MRGATPRTWPPVETVAATWRQFSMPLSSTCFSSRVKCSAVKICMCPRPSLIVLSRKPQNMRAKKPPTKSRPATPPPTIRRVMMVRRRLRNTLRNASSKNLPMSDSFGVDVGSDAPVGEAHDARGVFEKALIVSGKDKGDAETLIEVTHEVNEVSGVMSVEIGRRLVG